MDKTNRVNKTNKMNKMREFIKYNNLFIIILSFLTITVLPLKINIPWVSAAVKTSLGKAIVLVVPEGVTPEEFLASLGLSENRDFNKPKDIGKIISPKERNAAPENIALWLKSKDGALKTKDFSQYAQEIKRNKDGKFLEIANDAMLFPATYIGVEIWLKQVPSGILLKAGKSYQIESQSSKDSKDSNLIFKLNDKKVGDLTIPSDGKVHQVIIGYDGAKVRLGLDGKEKQQFTPSFATLSRSGENLLVNRHLKSLRIFNQPMGEERFQKSYNELASNFGRENLMEKNEGKLSEKPIAVKDLDDAPTPASDIQEQLDLLKKQTEATTDFMLSLDTEAKLETTDKKAPAVGTAIIKAVTTDENQDGIDNETNSDGKSVEIKTRAVSKSAKIFTSFENNPGSASWVEKIKDDQGNYTGFKILLSQPVSKDVKVNWRIVESR